MERADIVFLQEVVPETFSYIESKLTQVFFFYFQEFLSIKNHLSFACNDNFPEDAGGL